MLRTCAKCGVRQTKTNTPLSPKGRMNSRFCLACKAGGKTSRLATKRASKDALRVDRGSVPVWAEALIRRVCKAYKVPLPRIRTWRNTNGKHSSGRTWPAWQMISISCGTNEKDARYVVLHELGHYLAPAKAHHGSEFCKIAQRLYKRFHEDPLYCVGREARYMKRSVKYASPALRKAHAEMVEKKRLEREASLKAAPTWRLIEVPVPVAARKGNA